MPLFDPNNLAKILWDVFVLMTLTTELFIYTIERSFDIFILESSAIYKGFLIALLFLMIFDILMTLNTKIYTSGLSVRNRTSIFISYIKNNSLIDIASFAGVLLYFFSPRDSSFIDFNLLLILKILGTKKDLASRFKNLIIKKSKNAEAIYELLSLGAKILTCGHIIACMWHLVSFSHTLKYPEENSWIKERGLLKSNWSLRYLYSIYWGVTTMLTVGYGDITPQNSNETFFNIWAMLFGCVIFGYSMNRIGEILKYRDKHSRSLKYFSLISRIPFQRINKYIYNIEI